MKNSIVIAESGGTKTDWCLIVDNEIRQRLTTESYHPNAIALSGDDEIKTFWQDKKEWTNASLYFFGAGCYKPEGSCFMQDFLEKIFAQKIHVYSDLHAAGFAAHGDQFGNVAILGTGSVFFRWSGKTVDSIIGGLGFLNGDQGSGYYFGKLLVEKYLDNSLSEEQLKIVLDELNISDLVRLYGTDRSRFTFASVAAQLSEHSSLFSALHRENILSFYDDHLSTLKSGTLTMIGTYSAGNQQLIRSVLMEKGWEVTEFIERPVERLIERRVYFIE